MSEMSTEGSLDIRLHW